MKKLPLPSDYIIHRKIGFQSNTTGEAKDLFKELKKQMKKKSKREFFVLDPKTWEPMITEIAGMPVTITIQK